MTTVNRKCRRVRLSMKKEVYEELLTTPYMLINPVLVGDTMEGTGYAVEASIPAIFYDTVSNLCSWVEPMGFMICEVADPKIREKRRIKIRGR